MLNIIVIFSDLGKDEWVTSITIDGLFKLMVLSTMGIELTSILVISRLLNFVFEAD